MSWQVNFMKGKDSPKIKCIKLGASAIMHVLVKWGWEMFLMKKNINFLNVNFLDWNYFRKNNSSFNGKGNKTPIFFQTYLNKLLLFVKVPCSNTIKSPLLKIQMKSVFFWWICFKRLIFSHRNLGYSNFPIPTANSGLGIFA